VGKILCWERRWAVGGGAFSITIGKRGWSEESCCAGLVGGPFAGRCPPPLATFAARVARNSASRNGLSLQSLRLYQRHRRQSPHTGPLSPRGGTQPTYCRTASSSPRNLRPEANLHPGGWRRYPPGLQAHIPEALFQSINLAPCHFEPSSEWPHHSQQSNSPRVDIVLIAARQYDGHRIGTAEVPAIRMLLVNWLLRD
jgi:hypothetical protein